MPRHEQERRAHPRLPIRCTFKVHGLEANGAPWDEMTNSEDASTGGMSLVLQHAVERGQVLLMSGPLPQRLRWYDNDKTTYQVWGLVRHIGPGPQGMRVRVKFLGRVPPKDYEQNPGCRYLLPGDPPPAHLDRRKYHRLSMSWSVKLHRLGPDGQSVHIEPTITEDLSKGGARVLTAYPLNRGDIVMIEEAGGPYKTRAEVRHVGFGKDHVIRLNLRFLDDSPPDRIVPA
ncbi:MAG: PilZ domain-containing protein [Vicinamibacteria bacterium]|nr:PilZ domain-containing protein [Vicinamibacteria bacterium]